MLMLYKTEIADIIKELRKRKDMPQCELAAFTGVYFIKNKTFTFKII